MSNTSFTAALRDAIKRLSQKEDLSNEETHRIFDTILNTNHREDDKLTDEESALLASFLTAMMMKGATVGELVGAARAMRHHSHRIQILGSPVVDIVGTGGDGVHSFNISTTSAFVAAGAGLVMAKHGNRAVSSRCGSADVLEQCGVDLSLPPEQVEEQINERGIGFLFAQRFHPAMKRVAPLRRHLGFRTLFNLLGPLTNPAGATCAVIGVYDPQLTEMFAAALLQLGYRRAMVVHGYDGMDELTTATRSRVTELKEGVIKTYDFFPELYFDGELSNSDALVGGDAVENAKTLRDILSGKITDARRNIVLLNSAAAIVCGGLATKIEDGLKLAAQSIDSGAARDKLEGLVRK